MPRAGIHCQPSCSLRRRLDDLPVCHLPRQPRGRPQHPVDVSVAGVHHHRPPLFPPAHPTTVDTRPTSRVPTAGAAAADAAPNSRHPDGACWCFHDISARRGRRRRRFACHGGGRQNHPISHLCGCRPRRRRRRRAAVVAVPAGAALGGVGIVATAVSQSRVRLRRAERNQQPMGKYRAMVSFRFDVRKMSQCRCKYVLNRIGHTRRLRRANATNATDGGYVLARYGARSSRTRTG